MNNQFATQFLLEEMDAYDSLRSSLRELGASEDAIEILVNAVKVGLVTPSKAIEITKATTEIHETSPVGGGVTGGPTAATFTPGAGEQVAGAKKAFKKKYQESTYEDNEVAVFDGGEDGITRIYKNVDGSFYGINDEFDFTAENEKEMLHKLSQFGYKHLSGTLNESTPKKRTYQENENSREPLYIDWEEYTHPDYIVVTLKDGRKLKISQKHTAKGSKKVYQAIAQAFQNDRYDITNRIVAGMLQNLSEDAPRLAAGKSDIHTYTQDGFTKAPSAQEAGKHIKGVDVEELWEDGLKESRAYSQFKKEAATRTKDQQMHEAVKMIHNRLAEVSKLLEYAQQMRTELSEGEQTLEYNHNTKKMFERINSKVVEIYSKTRELK